MSHNKRHLRTMPDGTLAITNMAAEDNALNEVYECQKAQFELGRKYLIEPSGVDAYRTITEHGLDWRSLVHYVEWLRWAEPLPLDACHCVDVNELPLDLSKRDNWVLKGNKVVINEG